MILVCGSYSRMFFVGYDYQFCLGIRILEYNVFCNILGLEKNELYLNIQDIVRCRNLKEKILRAVSYRSRQLVNNGRNDLSSKIEMKLTKITMNVIWTASLIKTSLTITRTPTITLRSILKASLNIKNGKKKDNKVEHIVSDASEDIWAIPLQAMSTIQRLI